MTYFRDRPKDTGRSAKYRFPLIPAHSRSLPAQLSTMRLLNLLKSKIHRATVTDANVNYIGSVTIDRDLIDHANLQAGELVHVWDVDNGNRFETYVMEG